MTSALALELSAGTTHSATAFRTNPVENAGNEISSIAQHGQCCAPHKHTSVDHDSLLTSRTVPVATVSVV